MRYWEKIQTFADIYNETDPSLFTSRKLNRPTPLIIDNAEEWEVETILNYCLQNNKHEFLIHWKGYDRSDNSWKPIESLDNAQEIIQEYWIQNHPDELMPA